MTRRILLALALASPLVPAESAHAEARTVTVAAASDLKFAFDEVLVGFKAAHPELTVTVTYGSSGTFSTQLQQGAPFDLFLSADLAYPKELETKGMIVPGSTFQYAAGRLVVWVPNTSALDVTRLGMEALRAPEIGHVAIANPAHAPYGRAAEAALKTYGVYDAVQPKLVLGENIAQTAQFVQTGAADVGLIAFSLAVAPPMATSGRYWEVPLTAYPTLEQGGCILRSAQDPDAARILAGYLTATEGRTVLKKYGFFLPEKP